MNNLTAAEIMQQAKVWRTREGVDVALEEMDADHRANLIPMLRRIAAPLYLSCTLAKYDHAEERGEVPVTAEEWLEATPLMRRLVELEQGRPFEERRATHERNLAYEAAHPEYRKVGT